MGLSALHSWLCLLGIAMNLFINKQVSILSFNVTATDAIAIGYLLGLNIIQEYFGKKEAQKHVKIFFLVSFGFLILSHMHLWYVPNAYDTTHQAYVEVLSNLPRILIASLFSFLVIQFLDISFFNFLKNKFKNFFTTRAFFSLTLSQILDTFIFSLIGLWGIVENLKDIILVSLAIKILIIFMASPFLTISKFFRNSSFKVIG